MVMGFATRKKYQLFYEVAVVSFLNFHLPCGAPCHMMDILDSRLADGESRLNWAGKGTIRKRGVCADDTTSWLAIVNF